MCDVPKLYTVPCSLSGVACQESQEGAARGEGQKAGDRGQEEYPEDSRLLATPFVCWSATTCRILSQHFGYEGEVGKFQPEAGQ